MGRTITLQPGSPCNDFRGYCDVFMRCRLVDADGPLARLKKAIFSPELYDCLLYTSDAADDRYVV